MELVSLAAVTQLKFKKHLLRQDSHDNMFMSFLNRDSRIEC